MQSVFVVDGAPEPCRRCKTALLGVSLEQDDSESLVSESCFLKVVAWLSAGGLVRGDCTVAGRGALDILAGSTARVAIESLNEKFADGAGRLSAATVLD
jgi:hypothetical protein